MCASAYSALLDEMNLRTIPHLAEAFGVLTGLSDHTLSAFAQEMDDTSRTSGETAEPLRCSLRICGVLADTVTSQ